MISCASSTTMFIVKKLTFSLVKVWWIIGIYRLHSVLNKTAYLMVCYDFFKSYLQGFFKSIFIFKNIFIPVSTRVGIQNLLTLWAVWGVHCIYKWSVVHHLIFLLVKVWWIIEIYRLHSVLNKTAYLMVCYGFF